MGAWWRMACLTPGDVVLTGPAQGRYSCAGTAHPVGGILAFTMGEDEFTCRVRMLRGGADVSFSGFSRRQG